jgi:peptide/nickel transport system substrate-binding protein
MVASMDYPDDYTIVVNLAFPYTPFPTAMAYYPYFNILPVEAESGFDPRSEMRGSGPFRLVDFQPDVKLAYEKNTDWYEENRPFLDGIDQVIIPEYAAALAQFEAGTLWTMPGMAQEDVLPVKQRHLPVLDEAGYAFP